MTSSHHNSRVPKFLGATSADTLRAEMESGGGLITFSCPNEDAVLELAHAVGPIMNHRDSDGRGITSIRDTPGRDPRRDIGLTTAALPPHTDRPAIDKPPRLLLLWCKISESEGGEAIAAHGADVVEALAARSPGALEAFSAPEAAIFRTGSDQRICPVFSFRDKQFEEVRLRFDPFVHFSLDAARHLSDLERAIDEVAHTFELSPGMGYALRNDQWVHGRTAYQGAREMSRVMIAAPE